MKMQCDKQSLRECKSSRDGTQIGEQSAADGKKNRFPLHPLATDLDPHLKRQRDPGNHLGAGRIPLNLTDLILGADTIDRLLSLQAHTAHDLEAVAVVVAPTLNVNGAAIEIREETTANALGTIETVVAETKPEALPPAQTCASEKKAMTLLDGCLNQPVRAETEQ